MTEYINVRGFVKWCKVYDPEEFRGDTRWTTAFYPANEHEMKKLQRAGLQLEFKEDEDGKYVRPRRAYKKLFGKDDEITYFTPPKLTGEVDVKYVRKGTDIPVTSFKKSEKIDIEAVGEKKLIGNLSEVVINLAVFPTQQGNGHRWNSLKVLKLVEFNREDVDEAKEEPASPKEEVKAKPEKVEKPKKTTTLKEDMNDEIPW